LLIVIERKKRMTKIKVGAIFGRDSIGAYEAWQENITTDPATEVPEDMRVEVYVFDTEAEANAYRQGVEDGLSWMNDPYFLESREIEEIERAQNKEEMES
jgi:hypothetical protein